MATKYQILDERTGEVLDLDEAQARRKIQQPGFSEASVDGPLARKIAADELAVAERDIGSESGLETAGRLARRAASGASFGLLDAAASRLPGAKSQAERKAEEQRPSSQAAELVGGIGSAFVPFGGVGLLAKGGQAIAKTVSGAKVLGAGKIAAGVGQVARAAAETSGFIAANQLADWGNGDDPMTGQQLSQAMKTGMILDLGISGAAGLAGKAYRTVKGFQASRLAKGKGSLPIEKIAHADVAAKAAKNALYEAPATVKPPAIPSDAFIAKSPLVRISDDIAYNHPEPTEALAASQKWFAPSHYAKIDDAKAYIDELKAAATPSAKRRAKELLPAAESKLKAAQEEIESLRGQGWKEQPENWSLAKDSDEIDIIGLASGKAPHLAGEGISGAEKVFEPLPELIKVNISGRNVLSDIADASDKAVLGGMAVKIRNIQKNTTAGNQAEQAKKLSAILRNAEEEGISLPMDKIGELPGFREFIQAGGTSAEVAKAKAWLALDDVAKQNSVGDALTGAAAGALVSYVTDNALGSMGLAGMSGVGGWAGRKALGGARMLTRKAISDMAGTWPQRASSAIKRGSSEGASVRGLAIQGILNSNRKSYDNRQVSSEMASNEQILQMANDPGLDEKLLDAFTPLAEENMKLADGASAHSAHTVRTLAKHLPYPPAGDAGGWRMSRQQVKFSRRIKALADDQDAIADLLMSGDIDRPTLRFFEELTPEKTADVMSKLVNSGDLSKLHPVSRKIIQQYLGLPTGPLRPGSYVDIQKIYQEQPMDAQKQTAPEIEPTQTQRQTSGAR